MIDNNADVNVVRLCLHLFKNHGSCTFTIPENYYKICIFNSHRNSAGAYCIGCSPATAFELAQQYLMDHKEEFIEEFIEELI